MQVQYVRSIHIQTYFTDRILQHSTNLRSVAGRDTARVVPSASDSELESLRGMHPCAAGPMISDMHLHHVSSGSPTCPHHRAYAPATNLFQ